MNDDIQFVVLGFSTGAIYVALALGLLTIYRATAVVNFAQGAMAMWGAYVFAALRANGHLVLPVGTISLGAPVQTIPALVIGILMGLFLSVVVHYLVSRPLRDAPTLARVVASIALLVMFQALAQIRFGANIVVVPGVLPSRSVSLGGLSLSLAGLLLAGISLALCALVWAAFRYSNLGTSMRASSVNERGLMLMGYSPNRLGLTAWAGGVTLSTAVVILASPATGLNPINYTLYVIPALSILLLARMTSLWIIAAAGLGLGSFQSLITFLLSKPWWPSWGQVGVQDSVPFVLIVVALCIWGGRLPSRGAIDSSSLPRVELPKLKPLNIVLPIAIPGAALVFTHGTYRFGVITSITTALVALSYVLITGYVGQISLAQIAFAGASGFMLSKFTTSWGIPFPVSILLSALVASLLGLLVALPALRIRGTQLAIVTLAAAITIQDFVFSNPSFSPSGGNTILDPTLFGLNLSIQRGQNVATLTFGFMVLIVAVLLASLFVVMARGQTGRAWLAVRSNERAAAGAGVSVRSVKLGAFSLSAFIAGGAGGLIGYSQGQLSASSFTVSVGLLLFAVSYMGGLTSISGAIVAGAIGPLGIVYVVLQSQINFGEYYSLVAGIGLVVGAVLNPVGVAGKSSEQWRWLKAKVAGGQIGDQAGDSEEQGLPPFADQVGAAGKSG